MDIDALLATVGPYQWLTSGLVVIALPIYRIRCPDLPRPFKVNGMIQSHHKKVDMNGGNMVLIYEEGTNEYTVHVYMWI